MYVRRGKVRERGHGAPTVGGDHAPNGQGDTARSWDPAVARRAAVLEHHEDHLMVTATDGHEAMVRLTEKTQYEQDKKAATRSALVAGVRVSIQLTEDNKTAVKIKIGTAAAK